MAACPHLCARHSFGAADHRRAGDRGPDEGRDRARYWHRRNKVGNWQSCYKYVKKMRKPGREDAEENQPAAGCARGFFLVRDVVLTVGDVVFAGDRLLSQDVKSLPVGTL